MIKKLVFTIGTQDKDNKKLFYPIDSLMYWLAKRLDYATFTECKGCYKYNDGSICFEPSLKVEIILFDDDYKKQIEICNIIELCCKKFNQESYLYELFTSNSYNTSILFV